MDTDNSRHWNVKDLLADLMGATAELRPSPRAEIWASDLGKPYIDRWLQMKGVPYSNPPNGQGLMTFFLGKQIERGLEEMLVQCGVAVRSQEKVTIRKEDWLPVVGRPDLVVEVADWQEVVAAMDGRLAEDAADAPGTEAQVRGLKGLLALWRERCPDGLYPMVCEVKSLNSLAFKYHRGAEGLSNAYPHHRLQLYTYLYGLGIAEGHLLYIARDTGWMEEVIVRPTDELDRLWREDIEAMTRYYRSDRRPPLEPRKLDGKDNWRVSTSRYKDYLYKEGDDGAFAF